MVRVDNIVSDISAIKTRLDSIDSTIDDHETRITSLTQRMTTAETLLKFHDQLIEEIGSSFLPNMNQQIYTMQGNLDVINQQLGIVYP